jgi:dipeptidyl aminopeptidase/acylaminoacyl peptidase
MSTRLPSVFLCLIAAAFALASQTHDAGFTIEQIMSPAFPYGLVGAKHADRVAWMEDERGMRNVYTAAAPDFKRVRITAVTQDDAVDLQSVQLSDDGSVAVFVRGHTANLKGQIGNQGSDAEGGRREIWAASTGGSRPAWRVAALRGEARAARGGGGDDGSGAGAGGGRGGGRGAGGGGAGRGGGGGGGRGAEAALSPDGKWVLYLEDGQIHRAAVGQGKGDPAMAEHAPPFFVTLGEDSDPVWSPDSRKVAFVTARSDQRQYFPTEGQAATHSFIGVYDLDSRHISYLAPSVDRDTNPVWSPDGKQIAFLRRPGLPFGHFATTPLRSIRRDQVPPGFLDAAFEGGYTLGLWVADAASGEGRQIWHNAPHDTVFTQMSGLEWVGERIVFRAEQETWPRIFSVSVPNPVPEPVLLTPGEGEVERVAFSPDGHWLYYTSNLGDQDRRHVWRVPVAGGHPEQLTQGPLIETTLAIPGSGRYVAALQSGPRQPVSVALFAATGGEGRVIGPPLPANFPAAKHVVPESVVITAADGVKSHVILFLPADLRPGEKHPALLYLHGNGGRLVLGYPDQSNGYYQSNYALIEYFVDKGYIVAAMNYRGDGALYSAPYNRPGEYGANGVSEYRDALAAGLYLKNRPDVDPEQLGVWGLSYGGWITGEALSRNSDLFRAGAIFAGVQLRSTSLDPENLAYQSSPAFNVAKWTSPTLFIHGDDDRNVEFSQTVGMVQALRARGTPYKTFVMPDETHYMLRFATRAKAFHQVDDWFETMLIRGNVTRTTQRN